LAAPWGWGWSGWETEDGVLGEHSVETLPNSIPPYLGCRHLGIGVGPGREIALRHLKAEARVDAIDPVLRRLPGLAPLQHLLLLRPGSQTFGSQAHRRGLANECGEACDTRVQRLGNAGDRDLEGILSKHQAAWSCRWHID